MVYSASGTVNVQQNATLALTLSLMVTAMAAGNKTFSDPPVAGNGTIPGSQDITVQGKHVNNANDVYSVNIAWSAMEFTYTIPSTAEWDPEKHVYTAGSDGDNGTWSCDTTDEDKITVTNHSNKPVTVGYSVKNVNITDLNAVVTGLDDTNHTLPTAENTTVANAPKIDFTILPTGVMPHDYATLSDLFTFTVTLAK